MNEHLSQITGSIDPTACGVGLWCLAMSFLKWLNLIVIPEYILLGSAVVLTWQLYRMYRLWRESRRDRSQDGDALL